MADFPTPEQIAVAWLSALPVVPVGKVATTLPADPTTWAAAGFVQVMSVGGDPVDPGLPKVDVVQTVDCWANSPNSQRPPWGKAGSLAAGIVHSAQTYRHPVRMVIGADFYDVLLHAVYPVSVARRVTGDPSGFARYQADLLFAYAVAVTA